MKRSVIYIEDIIKEIAKEEVELKHPEIIGTNWQSLFDGAYNPKVMSELSDIEVYYREHLNRELYCSDSLPDGVTNTDNGYYFKTTVIEPVIELFGITCPDKFKWDNLI